MRSQNPKEKCTMIKNICQQFAYIALALSIFQVFGSMSVSAELLRGTVSVDGSSTVFPISEAVAEEFLAVQPRVRVTVGVSGTGGGFKKFLAGEIDINDASRPIKMKEVNKANDMGIGYIELPVAYDGLSVVINKENNWVDYLTVAELNKIWQPGSTVTNWSDIREGWP
jgi:phosphate transport system substrate-binding protein